MKIQSPDIPHKSEVGGVRVKITTKGEAFIAYRELLDNAQKHRPNAAIQGVLVGPMAKKGVEIIIGTLLDATFGPMIMVGLGGITTELFRDVIYRPAPVGAAEASAMLAELKAAPLLNGFRGAAKADVPALSQLIAQVSMLAAAPRRRDFRDRAQPGAGAPDRAGRHDGRCAGGEEEIAVVPLSSPLPLAGRGRGCGCRVGGASEVRGAAITDCYSFARGHPPPQPSPARGEGTIECAKPHRPLKLATRRSVVALTPSLKSSVARSLVCSTSS